jgi:hypothetical protein
LIEVKLLVVSVNCPKPHRDQGGSGFVPIGGPLGSAVMVMAFYNTMVLRTW